MTDKEIVEELKKDTEFMDAIREGVKAYKEGKITPWEDVKKELGIK